MFGSGSKKYPEPEDPAVQTKRERGPEVRSVLVIHQGALGDFILALPVLRGLRRGFPEAKSVYMGYPRILELAERRFYADEILSVDQKGMASFFVPEGALDFALSQFFSTFELIVVFGRDQKSARQAKERMKLVLIHDRTDLTPGALETLKDELIAVISRHVEIEPGAVRIEMTQEGREQRLIADIPLRTVQRRRLG